MAHRHAPRRCPVCGGQLVHSRLSCQDCDIELTGTFEPCEYCNLEGDDRELLRFFLLARGNLKELQRHLGVSYTTARLRYEALLERLNFDAPPARDQRLEILQALARGELTAEDARRQLTDLDNN